MSVQAITWALSLTGELSTSEKFTLVCLANYAGGDGRCHPGQKRLAQDTGLTERTVRTSLASLESKGYISRRRRERDDGTRTSDEYQIHTEPNRKPFPVEEPDNRKSTTGQPETISGQYKPIGLSEPVSEPSETRARVLHEFDDWYSAYPHKVGKGAARTAFAKARKIAGLPTLKAGLAAYVRTKPPDRAWCNPATWLNQERWTDQPDETPRHSNSKSDQRARELADYKRSAVEVLERVREHNAAVDAAGQRTGGSGENAGGSERGLADATGRGLVGVS